VNGEKILNTVYIQLGMIRVTWASVVCNLDQSRDWLCCDRKSRAACAQSFALRQQATMEITRRDHSIIACSRHGYIFLFFAHTPFVVNHAINTTPPERLQQHPLLFTTNHNDRTFFV